MLTSNKTVFISYRREPSKFLAIIVCKELQKRGYDVFLDIDSIGGGEFEKIILSQIAARSHFIVLLAHGSLDRCNEAGDWFRREIEYALQLGRTIIPILVDNFTFEISDKYLTGKLREIKNHNALPLYYQYIDAGLKRLCNQYLVNDRNGILIDTPEEVKGKIREIVEDSILESMPTTEELKLEELLIKAMGKQGRGDFDGAIADYEKILDENSDLYLVFYNLGVVYDLKGQYDEAIEAYSKVIDIYPRFAEAFYNRGVVYDKLQDWDNTIADFTRAIEINPRYEGAYNNRGIAHFHNDDAIKALLDFDRITTINPQNAATFNNRGAMQLELGYTEEAFSDLNNAIQIKPNYDEAYYNRGRAYLMVGQLDKAVDDFNKCIEINPEYAKAYLNRGIALGILGKYEEAILDFEMGLKLAPNRFEAYQGLANCYQYQGRYIEALNSLEKYLGSLNRPISIVEKQQLKDLKEKFKIFQSR